MAELRIVSYNIHKGRSLSGRDSLQALRLHLHGLRPDLMFLQEVQGRNEQRSASHAQHESLAAALHMNVAYGCNAVRMRTDHGNALLTHYPIMSFENLDISDHVLEQRGLLHAQVQVGKHIVHCFVVHLGLFAGGRERQVDLMVERIRQTVPDGAPILIAGDFNDWRDELAPMFVQQLGLNEVFAHASQTRGGVPGLRGSMRQIRQILKGDQPLKSLYRDDAQRLNQLPMSGAYNPVPPPKTFPAKFPLLRLDRIYQRGFSVKRAHVLRGKPWSILSDHSPILAELELE